MPAVSKAQSRFFYAMKSDQDEAKEKGISKQTVSDFTTGGTSGLPERVEDRHPAVISRHRTRHGSKK